MADQIKFVIFKKLHIRFNFRANKVYKYKQILIQIRNNIKLISKKGFEK